MLEHDTRIFYVHDLLSDAECDHLVKRARASFARSTVVGQNGAGAVDPIRNSEGTWINRRSDSVMSRINARISLITHLPVSHQEDMQILKYESGQHYYPHQDWFHTAPEKSEANGECPRGRLAWLRLTPGARRQAAVDHHPSLPQRLRQGVHGR